MGVRRRTVLAALLGLTLAALGLLDRARPPAAPAPPAPAPPAPEAPPAAPPSRPYPELLHRIPPEWLDPPPAPARLPPPPDPSVGWRRDATYAIADVRALASGSARPGSLAEARAEAVREDLARFPPPASEVRRLLASGPDERLAAFLALAARPPEDDAIVSLALKSLSPGDEPALRLLAAELVAALPPAQVARVEDELLAAFEVEPSPLALAVALPGLERMDSARLARLLEAQAARADDTMRPVLLRLAASRLGPEALEGLGPAPGAAAEAP